MYVLAACWAYEGMTVLPHLFTDEQVKEITLKNDSRILIDFDDVIFSTLKRFFESSCDSYMFVKVNAVSNDMAERIKANTAFDRAEKELSDEITYGEPKGEEDSNKMTEVVINSCFGGFSLSEEGVREYLKRKGKTLYVKSDKYHFNHYYTSPDMTDESYFYDRDIKRDDPDLVAVVKELGKKANGDCASLYIVKVPANVQWTIEEYDGSETVEEVHRSFY